MVCTKVEVVDVLKVMEKGCQVLKDIKQEYPSITQLFHFRKSRMVHIVSPNTVVHYQLCVVNRLFAEAGEPLPLTDEGHQHLEAYLHLDQHKGFLQLVHDKSKGDGLVVSSPLLWNCACARVGILAPTFTARHRVKTVLFDLLTNPPPGMQPFRYNEYLAEEDPQDTLLCIKKQIVGSAYNNHEALTKRVEEAECNRQAITKDTPVHTTTATTEGAKETGTTTTLCRDARPYIPGQGMPGLMTTPAGATRPLQPSPGWGGMGPMSTAGMLPFAQAMMPSSTFAASPWPPGTYSPQYGIPFHQPAPMMPVLPQPVLQPVIITPDAAQAVLSPTPTLPPLVSPPERGDDTQKNLIALMAKLQETSTTDIASSELRAQQERPAADTAAAGAFETIVSTITGDDDDEATGVAAQPLVGTADAEVVVPATDKLEIRVSKLPRGDEIAAHFSHLKSGAVTVLASVKADDDEIRESLERGEHNLYKVQVLIDWNRVDKGALAHGDLTRTVENVVLSVCGYSFTVPLDNRNGSVFRDIFHQVSPAFLRELRKMLCLTVSEKIEVSTSDNASLLQRSNGATTANRRRELVVELRGVIDRKRREYLKHEITEKLSQPHILDEAPLSRPLRSEDEKNDVAAAANMARIPSGDGKSAFAFGSDDAVSWYRVYAQQPRTASAAALCGGRAECT